MAKRRKGQQKTDRSTTALPVLRTAVAGIDLGAEKHWVAGPPTEDGEPNVRVFGTTTPQLQLLADWLRKLGVQSVAMESTSVYWIPLYELLESVGFEVLLVNARELKTVPGRKTDMQDCQWIQLLHSCGLLRGSFRPKESICSLRALQRQLANLVQERSKVVQWMQKALDQMNVQVHRAVTDITGKTGIAIVRAIVNGERDPAVLAALRDPRCRKSAHQIAEHLTGNWRSEHLFNLEQTLRLYDCLQEQIVAYDQQVLNEIKAMTPPERKDEHVPAHPKPSKQRAICQRGEQELRETLCRFSGVDLTRIDGIAVGTAQIILSEVGIDLSAFPDENHFASWLRLSPRTGFSAGKKLKKKTAVGASRIAHALALAAMTLEKTQTALGAFFRKKARHKERGVAVFATARKLAHYIYRMLRYGVDYHDQGAKAYEERFNQRRLKTLSQSANSFGFNLTPLVLDAEVVSG